MSDAPERIALVEMFGTYALWNSRDFALQKPVAQYVRAEAAEAALAARDAEIARLRSLVAHEVSTWKTYLATPQDRGGSLGPKGQARTAWMEARAKVVNALEDTP